MHSHHRIRLPSPGVADAQAKFSYSAPHPGRTEINRHSTAQRDNLTLRFIADADYILANVTFYRNLYADKQYTAPERTLMMRCSMLAS